MIIGWPPKEAYELGLIKNIISADIEWSKEVFDQLTACGAPKIPKTKLNSKNKMDKNKIISALGLAADTTEWTTLYRNYWNEK